MNSRYGFWFLSVCCIGLAGCANWQSRSSTMGSPGSAASLTLAPTSDSGTPPVLGPVDSPDMPPPGSGPGMDPFGAPAPERLDLSVSDSETNPPRAEMYNLSKPKSSREKDRVETADSSSKRNSTIKRLAVKSRSEKKSSKSDGAKRASTLDRLSADAAKPSKSDVDEKRVVSERVELASKLPVPKAVSKAKAPGEEGMPTIDTLLARPVRKGEDIEAHEVGNGPQSRAMPDSKLFRGMKKPVIYPVSNPAVDEPVDITEFS